MSEIKSYKDLLIWQKGIEIVKEVYNLCKLLPDTEIFGLQSQLKRASVSIPSNIAEGYGRNYTKTYIQFLVMARGSLLELETQIILTKELNFLNTEQIKSIDELIKEESKMLNAFINSLKQGK